MKKLNFYLGSIVVTLFLYESGQLNFSASHAAESNAIQKLTGLEFALRGTIYKIKKVRNKRQGRIQYIYLNDLSNAPGGVSRVKVALCLSDCASGTEQASFVGGSPSKGVEVSVIGGTFVSARRINYPDTLDFGEPEPDPVPPVDPLPIQLPGRNWLLLQGTDKPGTISDSNLKKVEGLSIRPSWRTLNPSRGQYNWSQIDQAVERTKRLGKILTIRVMTGVNAPGWLQNEGIPYLAGGVPHPQSDKLVKLWGEFLSAMGVRYSGESVIRLIHSTGIAPVSAEWHYRVHTDLYERSDFDGDKLADNWVKVTKMAAAAFPGKVISCNLGDQGKDWVALAYKRLKAEVPTAGFQINSWSAKSSLTWIGWTRIADAAAEGRFAGFQALSGSQIDRFGGSWKAALDKLKTTTARWVEIYVSDVNQTRK